MKNNFKSVLSVLALLGVLYWIFTNMMPQSVSKNENLAAFSTERAFKIVETIAEKPHYVGSENHKEIVIYLTQELQKIGLKPEFQEGFSLTGWGNLTKSKNILARIKGTNPSGKALLLLSHYDSAPHSYSKGASDDGSGVATILEGLRAFLYNKTPHKNDIVIVFTDAEELGLNGAALFVKEHKWAKDIGVVINFEARGSSGPSYMLMEVNNGNEKLVSEFANANTPFPASNSLMYSIYKMLPNDTDLTIFRERGQIPGYNFAFIDDHFNYHTVQDDAAHLDKKTLQHQGSYLMPLLQYLSNSDLNNLDSKNDFVYFNTPFQFVYYSFDWVLPIWFLVFLIFIGLVFLGLAKKTLSGAAIARGFYPLFGSIFTTAVLVFIVWKSLLELYPDYNDMLHGFTYNGYDYIVAFILLALSICFYFYDKTSCKKQTLDHFIAPLFVWILINLLIATKLKGAGFLIIPVAFSLIVLGYFIITEKTNWLLNILIGIPTLVIIAPFVKMFPIGLGLKIMYISGILVVLTFGLLLPVFGSFSKKRYWSVLLFVLSFGFLIKAHLASGFGVGKAKPNSLLYRLDADKNVAFWTTYDRNIDSWTKNYLGQNASPPVDLNKNMLFSKYKSAFTYSAKAPLVAISKPIITFEKDSIAGNRRFLNIKIIPTRKVNRYDIFAGENLNIQHFKANGVQSIKQRGNILERKDRKILSYYVVDSIPLTMQFDIDASKILDMELMESSFDLLKNKAFKINKREAWMMPMPFVLNDAVVIKQKIVPTIVVETIK